MFKATMTLLLLTGFGFMAPLLADDERLMAPMPGFSLQNWMLKCESDSCRFDRICGFKKFCPRGTCGMVDTCCDRTDYEPYSITGTDSGGGAKPIAGACYPRYRRYCRNFWGCDRNQRHSQNH